MDVVERGIRTDDDFRETAARESLLKNRKPGPVGQCSGGHHDRRCTASSEELASFPASGSDIYGSPEGSEVPPECVLFVPVHYQEDVCLPGHSPSRDLLHPRSIKVLNGSMLSFGRVGASGSGNKGIESHPAER